MCRLGIRRGCRNQGSAHTHPRRVHAHLRRKLPVLHEEQEGSSSCLAQFSRDRLDSFLTKALQRSRILVSTIGQVLPMLFTASVKAVPIRKCLDHVPLLADLPGGWLTQVRFFLPGMKPVAHRLCGLVRNLYRWFGVKLLLPL